MARVLITGCSGGLGRATALELARHGHEVVATARRPQTLEDLDVALRLALDVDDDASVLAARDAAGAVDVLVNNAGVALEAPVEEVPLAELRRLLETNVVGALRTIQAFLPGMRARGGGLIVNVSSIAGRVAAPLNGPYAASKFALEALSEALRIEAGHFGVRVAIIEPGAVATGMREGQARFVRTGSPYAALDRQWTAAMAAAYRSASPPELPAKLIAEIVDTASPRLRWPAGPDAEQLLGARSQMDDEAFHALVTSSTGLDW